MIHRNTQNVRGGFLILMLIAFSSIILGLAVTFYLYCKRGMDDGQIAIQIANQRLALRAAINYLAKSTEVIPPTTPITATRPNANPAQYTAPLTVDINGPTPRSQKLGWYRIRQSSTANFVYVTTGVGPSNGVQSPTAGSPVGWSANLWQNEYRAWYHVELDAAAAALASPPPYPPVIKSVTQVSPPTATSAW